MPAEEGFAVMSCILIAFLTGDRPGALVASNTKDAERNRGILCNHVSFIQARDSNGHLLDARACLIKMVKRKEKSSWGSEKPREWPLHPFERPENLVLEVALPILSITMPREALRSR